MKDPRVYIVPLVSLILIAAVLAGTGITGLMVGTGGPEDGMKELEGKVRITISENLVPLESMVSVSLDGQKSEMRISDFIEKSGGRYKIVHGEIPEIGYAGEGYAGGYSYTLDLSEFGLDMDLAGGLHTIITEVSYDEFVISSTAEDIAV